MRRILPARRAIPTLERDLFPGIDDTDSGGFKMPHIARGDRKASRGGAGCDVGIGGDGRFAGLFAARRDFSQFVRGRNIEIEGAVLKQIEHLFDLRGKGVFALSVRQFQHSKSEFGAADGGDEESFIGLIVQPCHDFRFWHGFERLGNHIGIEDNHAKSAP